jgi:ATP-dependent phosphoenolpyruvate carboxykinase
LENPKKHIFLLQIHLEYYPISKLTPGQAAYHFISGYTAKVAGTEAGDGAKLISLLVLAHHLCHFIQQSMLKC